MGSMEDVSVMWGVKEGGLRVGKLEGMVVVIRVWIDSLKRWVGERAMSQSEEWGMVLVGWLVGGDDESSVSISMVCLNGE